MRLLELKIKEYRVIRNLEINFKREQSESQHQPGYTLDFLAGVNGTGKSSVLRFLGLIFGQLENKDWISEHFKLKYQLSNGTIVRIENWSDDEEIGQEKKQDVRLLHWINDEGPYENRKIEDQYLPRHLVIYTTGDEDEWLEIFKTETDNQEGVSIDRTDIVSVEERYIKELPAASLTKDSKIVEEDGPFELADRLLFIQSNRLPAVALCGLIASGKRAMNGEEPLHPALQSVAVDSLAGFSLRCRAHKGLIHPKQQEILDSLAKCANRVIQNGADLLLVFDLTEQKSKMLDSTQRGTSIFDVYDTPLLLFQNINALYEHPRFQDAPLQEVNLFFKRSKQKEEDDPVLHLWDWLSDGERSFLARIALFALFQESNILILLDEPEVHFNDVWKREMVNTLHQIIKNTTCHALITTHSSIALSDVRKDDVIILERTGNYTSSYRDSGIETLGADPSDILVHVFGTRHATGERSVRFIKEQIAQATTQDHLKTLSDSIAPGYWRYRIQLEMEHMKEVTH